MPYVAAHLAELGHIEEEPDLVDGLINFKKNVRLEACFQSLRRLQAGPPPPPPLEPLHSLLLAPPAPPERALARLSLLREPPSWPPAALF